MRAKPLSVGPWAGYWAIRVSPNWRIVFRFEEGAVRDVDSVDYHRKRKRRWEADMGPMRNLEHSGAVMSEWRLEGADPAKRLGVDPGALQRVLDGRLGISPELAARLEAGGWSTAHYWLRLQAACNREQLQEDNAATAAA